MAIIKFMWCEIIKQILADMRQPLQYVPWALIIVVLGLVVTIVLSEKKDGKKASVRFFRILFAIYILVVIQITFFSREPGSRNGCMNLELFSTWGYSVVTHAFFIENILVVIIIKNITINITTRYLVISFNLKIATLNIYISPLHSLYMYVAIFYFITNLYIIL